MVRHEWLPPVACRVGREDAGWWVDYGKGRVEYFEGVDDMPDDVRSRLSVLLPAPDGFRTEGVGRRISADRYWIFFGE